MNGTIFEMLILNPVFSPAAQLAILEATNVNNNFTASDFMTVAVNIANFLIAFITLLGIIFIVWGAIQYVTSGGNEEAVGRAKNTIVYALIGLFIAAMSYALEDLVVNRLLS